MSARCGFLDAAVRDASSAGAIVREGIGATDCELLRDAALAQPVNTVTSLAYTLVGIWVAVLARRRGRLDATAIVFALCLVGVGLGSVLFHGPQPAGSRLLHDLPITLTVLFIVVHDLWLLRGRDRALVAFAPVAVGAAVVSLVDLDLATVVTAAGAGTIAVLEVLIARRRTRPINLRSQRRAYAVIVGISALAAVSYVLGRTGSPACDPDSLLQFHALWHVLTAAVFGAWWWLAFDLPHQPPGSSAFS